MRSRYLAAATVVAVLIVFGAVLANAYLLSVTQRNADGLQSRDRVTRQTGGIRNALWLSQRELRSVLILAETASEESVRANLAEARDLVKAISAELGERDDDLRAALTELRSQVETLNGQVQELLALSADPFWVYPALPHMTRTMLPSNQRFETAMELALLEFVTDMQTPYASPMYRRFDELRDLWRRMIVNFRAVMIRFAGLPDAAPAPQEENIENLYLEIRSRLGELEALRGRGGLSFQAEESLEEMSQSSQLWYGEFQEIKKLRRSGRWRRDLEFLNRHILPSEESVFSALQGFEGAVDRWSQGNVREMEQAARQLSWALWGVSALLVGFVIGIYLMLDRSILRPVAHMAGVLAAPADQIGRLEFSRHGSQEIRMLVVAFENMRDQVHNRQLQLEHQALHDALTGLPNRALLHDRLEHTIRLSSRAGDRAALMILDLDHFKEINDTLGHQVGDLLLEKVGQRLAQLLRGSDTVARLGGDEFAIAIPDAALSDAKFVADRIVAALDEKFVIKDHNLFVGVSVGIAMFPDHGKDAETLIRCADVAMYMAKRSKRGYAVYDAGLDQHSADQLALVGELRDALRERDQLQLNFQPTVDLRTGELCGVEALLRWHHPVQGAVPPEKIIRVAEHTGLIGALTLWIIDAALRQFLTWGGEAGRLALSINLSAWNLLDPKLPEQLVSRLRLNGIPCDRLTLEVTESALMDDPARAREILEQLHGEGIKVAIDDFGTGFSSLSFLKLLPVDVLKIDRSFVRDLLHDENDAAIVRSTIDLAHNLGLRVVAEGVESSETFRRLQTWRCDMAQGYALAGPMSSPELSAWIKTHDPAPFLEYHGRDAPRKDAGV